MSDVKQSQSSYKSIFKATSLFGGVQMYQILIELIKSKFVAKLLGPTGVGISGLYSSATGLIQQLTAFGLAQSAVRNVAEAHDTGNNDRVSRVVSVLRKLVWVTGLLGMLAVIILSPVLSLSSFGDYDHIVQFCIISITLLLTQISAGQRVILQGTRKLKYLAKSTALGVTIGLFISVPLYYIWGIDGIVPNIVISNISALLLVSYYSKKVLVGKVELTTREVLYEGKSMLTMGMAMSVTAILTSASSFAIRGYIRSLDGVEAVGLFSLGFVLLNQYTGLVFSAMSTDFYPRLSSVNNDNYKCRTIINQQNEVGSLILAPMLSACILFAPIVIKILASDKFLPITDYMVWAAWGMFFKMVSWSIGYIFLAKADAKLFSITEVITCLYTFILTVLGYKVLGLTGIGLASAISLLLYLIMVYIIAYKKYEFSFTPEFIKLFIIQFGLVSLEVLIVNIFDNYIKYILGSLVLIVCITYTYKELNYRIDISSFLKRKRN